MCPEFPGQPTAAHWSMPDPSAEGASDEESYPAFCRTADEIEVRVGLLIAEITNHMPERSSDAY